jgi:hypothetical protein
MTGERRWRANAPAASSSPAFHDGLVVVGTETGPVALDRDTGTERWQVTIGERVGAIAAASDGLYAAAGTLLALDGGGERRWSAEVPAFGPLAAGSLAVVTTLRVGEAEEALVALDPEDGTERWRTADRSRPARYSDPVVGPCPRSLRPGQQLPPQPLFGYPDHERLLDRDLTGEPRVTEPVGGAVVPVRRRWQVRVLPFEPDTAGATEPPSAAVGHPRGGAVHVEAGVEKRVPQPGPALDGQRRLVVARTDRHRDRRLVGHTPTGTVATKSPRGHLREPKSL